MSCRSMFRRRIRTISAFAPRRFHCSGCHHRVESRSGVMTFGNDARDPYLRLPLHLQARTRHGVLFAYNARASRLDRRLRCGAAARTAPRRTAWPTARLRRGFRSGSRPRRTARRCCARLAACAAALPRRSVPNLVRRFRRCDRAGLRLLRLISTNSGQNNAANRGAVGRKYMLRIEALRKVGLALGRHARARGVSASSATAQESEQAFFAGKTVRFVVGFGPGGGYDAYARMLAPYLSKTLGATVIVENRPGAGGLLALNGVYIAPPDGLTMMIVNGTAAVFSQLTDLQGARYDLGKIGYLATLSAPPSLLDRRPACPGQDDRAGAHGRQEMAMGRERPGRQPVRRRGLHLRGPQARLPDRARLQGQQRRRARRRARRDGCALRHRHVGQHLRPVERARSRSQRSGASARGSFPTCRPSSRRQSSMPIRNGCSTSGTWRRVSAASWWCRPG